VWVRSSERKACVRVPTSRARGNAGLHPLIQVARLMSKCVTIQPKEPCVCLLADSRAASVPIGDARRRPSPLFPPLYLLCVWDVVWQLIPHTLGMGVVRIILHSLPCCDCPGDKAVGAVRVTFAEGREKGGEKG